MRGKGITDRTFPSWMVTTQEKESWAKWKRGSRNKTNAYASRNTLNTSTTSERNGFVDVYNPVVRVGCFGSGRCALLVCHCRQLLVVRDCVSERVNSKQTIGRKYFATYLHHDHEGGKMSASL